MPHTGLQGAVGCSATQDVRPKRMLSRGVLLHLVAVAPVPQLLNMINVEKLFALLACYVIELLRQEQEYANGIAA